MDVSDCYKYIMSDNTNKMTMSITQFEQSKQVMENNALAICMHPTRCIINNHTMRTSPGMLIF